MIKNFIIFLSVFCLWSVSISSYSLHGEKRIYIGLSQAQADDSALDLDTDSVKSFGTTGASEGLGGKAAEVWITSIANGVAIFFYWQLAKRCWHSHLKCNWLMVLGMVAAGLHFLTEVIPMIAIIGKRIELESTLKENGSNLNKEMFGDCYLYVENDDGSITQENSCEGGTSKLLETEEENQILIYKTLKDSYIYQKDVLLIKAIMLGAVSVMHLVIAIAEGIMTGYKNTLDVVYMSSNTIYTGLATGTAVDPACAVQNNVCAGALVSLNNSYKAFLISEKSPILDSENACKKTAAFFKSASEGINLACGTSCINHLMGLGITQQAAINEGLNTCDNKIKEVGDKFGELSKANEDIEKQKDDITQQKEEISQAKDELAEAEKASDSVPADGSSSAPTESETASSAQDNTEGTPSNSESPTSKKDKISEMGEELKSSKENLKELNKTKKTIEKAIKGFGKWKSDRSLLPTLFRQTRKYFEFLNK